MSRVYVGNLDSHVTERELEDEFRTFGVLRSVWVARKLPGFAFVEFEDRRDASDAIHDLNGKNGWRVELSRSSGGGPRGRGGDEMKCYECGEPGHFARECRQRVGSGGRGRSRSPPRFRRSPSYGYGRRYSRSPLRSSISPRRKSISPRKGGRYGSRRHDRRYDSVSPRRHSPPQNGESYYRGRRHSRSP